MFRAICLIFYCFLLSILLNSCADERTHTNPVDPEYWLTNDVSPSNLKISPVSVSSLKLEWNDNSKEEMFYIERKEGTSANWNIIADIQGDYQTGIKKEFFDNSVKIGIEYSYRIYASYQDNKAFSSEVSYVTVLPSPYDVTPHVLSATSIQLQWKYDITGLDGFKIDRKIGTTGNWETDYSSASSSTRTWTDNGLATGTIYYYRIRSYYSTYNSSYSDIKKIIPHNFILAPAGTFSMGQDGITGSTPVHTVNLTKSYYLSKYPVTQSEWVSVIGSNPSSGHGVGDDYPVYNVSWYYTFKYCNLLSISHGYTPCYSIKGSTDPNLWGTVPEYQVEDWDKVICDWEADGYRLPTEAEWEYAARYNDSRTYPWGNAVPNVTLCNYDSHVGETTPVGSYPSGNSKLGFSDMAGNVSEWTWDSFESYTSSTQTDPRTRAGTRHSIAIRGGSYTSPDIYVKSAYRSQGLTNPSFARASLRLARNE